jgi:hypothetical protein
VESSRTRSRRSILLALAAVVLATACGARPTPGITNALDSPAAAVALSPAPEPTPSEPTSTLFSTPPVQARLVAERFTFAFLTYDTRSERAQDFLQRVRPYSTMAVVEALGRSPRSRLPWRVMRSRSERVSLTIAGTSVSETENAVTLLLNGLITTRTDLAVLRSPVQLRLQVSHTRNGWKVTGVHGGGS